MNLLKVFFIAVMFALSFSARGMATYDVSPDNYHTSIFQYYFVSIAHGDNPEQETERATTMKLTTSIDGKVALASGENRLKLTLKNSSDIGRHIHLSLSNSLHFTKTSVIVESVNGRSPEKALTINRNNFRTSRVFVPPAGDITVYLRIVSEQAIELPMTLSDELSYLQRVTEHEFFKGVSLGGSVFLAVGVLFLFFASGSKTILLLCGYFSARAVGLAILLGSNTLYFFPDYPALRAIDIPIITAITALFLLWFSVELFSLKLKYVRMYRWIQMASLALLAYIPASFLLSVKLNFIACSLIHHSITGLLIIIGAQLIREKITLSRLFTFILALQFAFGLITVVGVALFNMTLFDINNAIFSVSFSINGMLLIFLVSRLFYVQVKQKEDAQKSALTSAMQTKEAQDNLLALQKENQDQLEARVQERTLELNIAFQELENLNKELAEKTTIDDLTKLKNRRFYDQKIQAEFRRSRRNLTPLSLVVVDIDHFKKVNDTYGHTAGDNCIVAIAQFIKSVLGRSTDIGCRYGGEEYCIILPETDLKGAISIAEELRRIVEENVVSYQDLEIALTISCGVAVYEQQSGATPESLFVAADKALYNAKQNGRNNVQVNQLKND